MKIVFMGTPDFAVPSLEQLVEDGHDVLAVVTQPDRPKGRKRNLSPPPVKEAALRHGLKVIQPQTLKGSDELYKIGQLNADLIVTAAYGQILPGSLLVTPPYGCINVHASLLPKYRGGAPIHKAIMEGEAETGVTIMYMVRKLDAGDIISQVSVPIENDDDVGTMHDKLSVAGARLLSATIPDLTAGRLEPVQQDEDQVTYAPNITREDECIDWSKSARDIYNHVRGLRPFPGAFTTADGDIYKIWTVQETGDTDLTYPPGTVYRLTEEGICVAAGDRSGVCITDLQPSGKKKMSAGSFLRGARNSWHAGSLLGE
jgi:methionyl-tRNA formyltransferase